MENVTLVTRGNATVAQKAQRPTHGECDCGCAAPFRGLVLNYKYTTGLNTLQGKYIMYMSKDVSLVGGMMS
jgi:hypothetical protein